MSYLVFPPSFVEAYFSPFVSTFFEVSNKNPFVSQRVTLLEKRKLKKFKQKNMRNVMDFLVFKDR